MIRDYQTSDFEGCVNVVNLVWQFDQHFAPPELAHFFKRVYTGGSMAGSNFLKVVEENGHVKGFLFGKIERQPLYRSEFSGF